MKCMIYCLVDYKVVFMAFNVSFVTILDLRIFPSLRNFEAKVSWREIILTISDFWIDFFELPIIPSECGLYKIRKVVVYILLFESIRLVLGFFCHLEEFLTFCEVTRVKGFLCSFVLSFRHLCENELSLSFCIAR